jgi:MFS family permease
MDSTKEDFLSSSDASKRSGKRGSIRHINIGYLIALLFTVALGTVQFGYSIGSWNATFEAY